MSEFESVEEELKFMADLSDNMGDSENSLMFMRFLANIRSAQSELAALREELAKVELKLSQSDFNYDSSIDEMQQRLAAAEQRNAEGSAAMQLATKLLDRTLSALNPRNSLAYEVHHFLAAHRKNKPTESGASE